MGSLTPRSHDTSLESYDQSPIRSRSSHCRKSPLKPMFSTNLEAQDDRSLDLLKTPRQLAAPLIMQAPDGEIPSQRLRNSAQAGGCGASVGSALQSKSGSREAVRLRRHDRAVVEHRFENHKNGYKSAWTVKKYGIRLMPELYEHLNPMPFEAAAQMEKDLTEDLRAEGYTVTGGT